MKAIFKPIYLFYLTGYKNKNLESLENEINILFYWVVEKQIGAGIAKKSLKFLQKYVNQ